MKDLLFKVDRILSSAMRWYCILCFVTLMSILSGVVLIRFWPISKLSWSDEAIEFFMANLVFVGAATLWRENAHFRIEALLKWIEAHRYGWILGVAVEAVSAAFIITFTFYSYELTVAARDVSPILSLPRPLWYAAMPISGLIMVGYSLVYSVQMARRTFERNAPPAPQYDTLIDDREVGASQKKEVP